MELKADFPYPSLETVKEDGKALRVLSPAYAGGKGELTAILQYVYQAITLEKRGMGKEGKRVMQIAANEMRHLELLGSAIVSLGAPPVFTACPPYPVGYYSASCVNYAKTPQEMFCADIAAEQAAIGEYERMLVTLSDPALIAVIERILMDERLHLAAFEEMQAAL